MKRPTFTTTMRIILYSMLTAGLLACLGGCNAVSGLGKDLTNFGDYWQAHIDRKSQKGDAR